MKPMCYLCDKIIEGKVKYIEWIPLFLRYVYICNECHERSGEGDTIENIKKYEDHLGKMGLGDAFKGIPPNWSS